MGIKKDDGNTRGIKRKTLEMKESKTSINKRKLILDTMRELLKEGTAGTASVNDIAVKAGIAKGGLYYYFHSKEEVMDALIEDEYKQIILHCEKVINESKLPAVSQIALLVVTYRKSLIDPSLDHYLHMPKNAALHQKSLANIIYGLSPIVSGIIERGMTEGVFTCEYPQEYAEMILTIFSFLYDPGIFKWSHEQLNRKLIALADFLENAMHVEKNSFSFLYQNE